MGGFKAGKLLRTEFAQSYLNRVVSKVNKKRQKGNVGIRVYMN